MATINATVMSLADWAKKQGPDGGIMDTVEMLSQINDLTSDLPFREGNLATGHQYNVRTGLPTVYWRIINQGVPNSKSRTAQATDACGMLEARSQVDQAMAELGGNISKLRLDESRPFFEAMAQEMAGTMFYGNQALAPEEFTGLSPRYSAISGANNASHVISAGGAGSDNASIWLTGMGEMGLHGSFPKGSSAGLKHEDMGLQDAFDADNNRFRAWMDHWIWKAGIVLPDWRTCVRICNIDISNLVAKSSAADLPELMIKATHRIPRSAKSLKYYWQMNRTCLEMLEIQLRDDVTAGGQLTYEKVDGMPVTSFRGIPIRISDQLLETEATVA